MDQTNLNWRATACVFELHMVMDDSAESKKKVTRGHHLDAGGRNSGGSWRPHLCEFGNSRHGCNDSGIPSKYPALAKGHFATVRNALLLAFMMAVAVPTSLHNLLPELAGWLLAGFVAQPVLRLLWIPIRPRQTNDQVPTAGETTDISPNWWKDASCIGFAMGLAIFAARALNLNHAFWVVLGVLPVLSATGRSPSRMFWKEQAGTFLGFLVAVALVICLGAHQSGYWFLLPCAVFFRRLLLVPLGS